MAGKAVPHRFVALLCGINVGGNRKVPMADLRALAEALGFTEAATYIQSGNLVFSDARRGVTAASCEEKLEAGLLARFGFPVEALVRSAEEWTRLAAGNPFTSLADEEASRVMMLLSRGPAKEDAAATLLERAKGGERIVAAEGALWIHYPGGAGTSKLTPALFDRLVGSKVTARNWRTVLTLQGMLAQR